MGDRGTLYSYCPRGVPCRRVASGHSLGVVLRDLEGMEDPRCHGEQTDAMKKQLAAVARRAAQRAARQSAQAASAPRQPAAPVVEDVSTMMRRHCATLSKIRSRIEARQMDPRDDASALKAFRALDQVTVDAALLKETGAGL